MLLSSRTDSTWRSFEKTSRGGGPPLPLLDLAALEALPGEQRDVVARPADAPRERVRRVVRDDAALVDDEDAPAGDLHLGEVVRRQDDRALLADLLDELADLDRLVRVEAAHRLVEDEDGRLVDQRLREADALLVALGELADGLRDHVLEADLLDHRQRAALRRLALEAPHRGDPLEVLEHEHLPVERRALRQVADRAAHPERVLPDVAAVDLRRPGARGDEAGQDAHRGRLAGPVPGRGGRGSRLGAAQAGVLESDEASVPLPEALGLDHHIAHARPFEFRSVGCRAEPTRRGRPPSGRGQ
ncbi:MAG: hypothetical protein M5U28_49885 [Sandaracinaceae bacterium]|nr:hypothetical protein [Sandaracinaceae bacterium]